MEPCCYRALFIFDDDPICRFVPWGRAFRARELYCLACILVRHLSRVLASTRGAESPYEESVRCLGGFEGFWSNIVWLLGLHDLNKAFAFSPSVFWSPSCHYHSLSIMPYTANDCVNSAYLRLLAIESARPEWQYSCVAY